MTTITIDRAVVEQALELLGTWAKPPARLYRVMDNLRAALAQQDEPTGKQPLQVESVAAVAENATTQQRVVETPPSDYRRGYWDGFSIGKREGRIEAEDALAQQDEPVQEPAAWRLWDEDPQGGGDWRYYDAKDFKEGIDPMKYFDGLVPLYLAPPQRKPLAEWQINDLMSGIDPEDVCSWSFRQGVYAAEKHHGVKL